MAWELQHKISPMSVPAAKSRKNILTNVSEYGTLAQSGATRTCTLAMEDCKHPRVRVLTREEDAEFVECLECGEVFDSHEFADMAIEELDLQEEEE